MIGANTPKEVVLDIAYYFNQRSREPVQIVFLKPRIWCDTLDWQTKRRKKLKLGLTEEIRS
jgi:hypothetical protein